MNPNGTCTITHSAAAELFAFVSQYDLMKNVGADVGDRTFLVCFYYPSYTVGQTVLQ